MSYSCLEELQVNLDLHALDKTSVLSKAGSKYDDGWLVVTNDGICHLFDKDGNLDDIKKITQLKEEYIRKNINKIVIPDSVTSIGKKVFSYCKKLTSVTIPNTVMNIRIDAFEGCSDLTNVMIPNSVTCIEGYAFAWCSRLAYVTIGNDVTSIGWDAFYGNSLLANLTFKGKTLEQVKKMNNYPWGIEDTSIIRVE